MGYLGAPAHLMRAVAPAQARCDAIQLQYRAEQSGERRSIRRDPPPRPPAPDTTDDVLNLRLADELDYARRMIDSMGDELSADSAMVMRHMVALQTIDVLGQMLGHIAAVVRSSQPEATVEQIGMGDLKARLQRKGGI